MIPRWLTIAAVTFAATLPIGLLVAKSLLSPRVRCWAHRRIAGTHAWHRVERDRLDNGDVRSVVCCTICGQLAVETYEVRADGAEASLVRVEVEEPHGAGLDGRAES